MGYRRHRTNRCDGRPTRSRRDHGSPGQTTAIDLIDVDSVYVFEDGKMGMVDKYGHATRIRDGLTMLTKGGQEMVMHGDEVARVDRLLRQDPRSN
jgi:hypothetical protein